MVPESAESASGPIRFNSSEPPCRDDVEERASIRTSGCRLRGTIAEMGAGGRDFMSDAFG
jgi:hypothetical protein